MIEIKQCCDTNIYILKNMLDEKQCAYFISQFEPIQKMQTVTDVAQWSEKLWEMAGEKLSAVEFYDTQMERSFWVIGFKPTVTVSKCRSPLHRHKDYQTEGDAFKLFFYLTTHTHDGGTDFFEPDPTNPDEPLCAKKIGVKNELGAGILFDISLEHASQPIPKGDLKISVGVRPIIEYK